MVVDYSTTMVVDTSWTCNVNCSFCTKIKKMIWYEIASTALLVLIVLQIAGIHGRLIKMDKSEED